MRVVDVDAPGAFDRAVQEIQGRPIVVQLPTVFVLLAAPTTRGARLLDAAKQRLPDKNYGTAIGCLRRFVGEAVADEMPEEFREAAHFEPMTGTFMRLRFRDAGFNSPAIRAGTHQGVLLGGVHRALFRCIEESFLTHAPDPMWASRNYSAPLCTSCNESGHPEGSIVALDKALAFAEARNIGLVLTSSMAEGELGSYPILGFSRDGVRIHRDGPALERFKELVPERLRSW